MANLSTIQAGFLRRRQMAKINRFQGLQSEIKQLSIYTVVLLCSRCHAIAAVYSGTNRNQAQVQEIHEHSLNTSTKERGYYGR